MKTYTIRGLYTISCEIKIEADSLEEAMEIADCCDNAFSTEWTGNSVFINESCLDRQVESMTVEADGMLRDLTCDDDDEKEDE